SGFLADPQPEPRRPRRRRPTWWETSLPILAGILMLGTVLYFKTRDGTLVVDVDDPAVKVQLDGAELTITGAGPQEVRLKPGAYHLVARKDGQEVQNEIVTIERNSKQIVKVIVKPNAATLGAGEPAMKQMEDEL